MKNLFDLAIKEFTQDAFLRWALENYDSLQVSRDLLKIFCELADGEEVKQVKTQPQWNKVDLAVFVTTDKREVGVFIIDKTFSSERGIPLKRYNKPIAKWEEESGGKAYKVLYKTNKVTPSEKAQIKEAGVGGDWKIFDIYEIFRIFGKYKSALNLIVAQYVENISNIYNAVTNVAKPVANSGDTIDLLKWEAYLKGVVDRLPDKDGKYTCSVVAGRSPYVCLTIEKVGEGKKPYLEVTSEDCANNVFVAKIKPPARAKVDDKAKADAYREEYINGKTYENWIIQDSKKEYAVSNTEQATSDGDFLNALEKYIESYLEVMSNWK